MACTHQGASPAVQAELAPLLDRTASQKAMAWTIGTKKLIASGSLAGTSAGCLAALSGIGGPPLILMYELLAVPKVPQLCPFTQCSAVASCVNTGISAQFALSCVSSSGKLSQFLAHLAKNGLLGCQE